MSKDKNKTRIQANAWIASVCGVILAAIGALIVYFVESGFLIGLALVLFLGAMSAFLHAAHHFMLLRVIWGKDKDKAKCF
ncbi:MAG TPA: hypothetical protein PKI61_00180 [bacterium]|nr:hypothetical protein [bacterium]HPT29462.1 hypothetical protein [bacterium]